MAETLGGLAEDAIITIRAIGYAIGQRTSSPDSASSTKHLFGHVAIALWRGNASLWLHCQPTLPMVFCSHPFFFFLFFFFILSCFVLVCCCCSFVWFWFLLFFCFCFLFVLSSPLYSKSMIPRRRKRRKKGKKKLKNGRMGLREFFCSYAAKQSRLPGSTIWFPCCPS